MPNSDPRPYKILSLDGGGTWALIQVRTLQKLFGPKATGHEVLENFSLVTANSGGSIVAAGLFMNLTLADIRRLFEDRKNREAIFKKLWLKETLGLGGVVLPQYDASRKDDGLLAALKGANSATKLPLKYFNQLTMHEAWEAASKSNKKLPHFLIVGYDYERDRARYFRSNRDSLAGTGGTPGKRATNPSFLHAVHASSNAPVMFFDDPAKIITRHETPDVAGEEQHLRMWDGAITGYNNPIVAGVIEALANQAAPEKIAILSLGTATKQRPIREDFPKKKSFTKAEKQLLAPTPDDPDPHWKDMRKMATSILADPPDIASYTAHVMLHGSVPGDNKTKIWPVVRLNPMIAPIVKGQDAAIKLSAPPGLGNPTSTDPQKNLKAFERLIKIGMDATEPHDVTRINRLTDAWHNNTVRNQPVIANGPGGRLAHIGATTFSQGHDQAFKLGLCTIKP
ncbi:MAG: hypothetical protein EP347_06615 [Alphaproteobacteria bacterium]|nr:MAG: hypothetical protein EP347_06615 [Alphaproteobacteria bacterium]